jgi:phage baseplate assembly protein W
MNTHRYRAWHFMLPDLDTAGDWAGLNLALTGGIDLVEEHDSVRQAIVLLLSTVPGERVMRPDYGCELHRLVFSPNDDTTAGLAMHYVRQALDRWERRIDIRRLDAARCDGNPALLEITLEYRVRATQRDDAVGFAVDLTGGLS